MKSKNYQTKDGLRKRFSGLGDSVSSLCKGLKTFFPQTRPFLEGPLLVTSENGRTTIESREGTISINDLSSGSTKTSSHIMEITRRKNEYVPIE